MVGELGERSIEWIANVLTLDPKDGHAGSELDPSREFATDAHGREATGAGRAISIA
jgi:hypothetical protein